MSAVWCYLHKRWELPQPKDAPDPHTPVPPSKKE